MEYWKKAGVFGLGVLALLGVGYYAGREYFIKDVEIVKSERHRNYDGRRLLENCLLEDRVLIRTDEES